MDTYVETICVVNGEIQNLSYHNSRMNRTWRELWHQDTPARLEDCLQHAVDLNGRVKVRVVYGAEGIMQVTSEPYRMKPIQSLRLVVCNDIDYRHKSTDRTALQQLLALRGDCDDIIVVRNNMLTDTSYSNIALYDGSRWVTPRTPLLAGTKRALLIDQGILTPAHVTPATLHAYTHVAIINAMIDLGRMVVPIDRIANPLL